MFLAKLRKDRVKIILSTSLLIKCESRLMAIYKVQFFNQEERLLFSQV